MKIGIETKYYKFLESIFTLLKLNFYMFIFSVGLIGIPSALATGFYFFNRYLKKGYDVQFREFKIEFLKNLKKSIYLFGPSITVGYVLSIYFKIGLIIFFPLLGYCVILLIILGLIENPIKNIYVFGGIFFTKNLALILLTNIITYYIFKNIIRFIPGILVYFNYLFVVVIYHFIFVKKILVNYSEYLRENLDEI
ncbi:MAG: hypothetical protein ACRCZ1_02100 [Cetobacterium sp.]